MKILVARHFQGKVKVFFNKTIRDGELDKRKYYTIHLHRFSLQQIFKMKLPILSL